MELGVLGPLTVDGLVARMPRRDRVVLAALAAHSGEVVGADRLADALWGARPPASWAKVVQGCVVRLRRVLGTTAIETVQNGYRLRLAADDVDALRFERLLIWKAVVSSGQGEAPPWSGRCLGSRRPWECGWWACLRRVIRLIFAGWLPHDGRSVGAMRLV
jgi:hypothetical protein